MWWLLIAKYTIYLYFYVTHKLKCRGERIRDVVVIYSPIQNLLILLCNSLAEVYRERVMGERIRYVVVIDSKIHNLLVLYVTHSLNYRENDWRKNKLTILLMVNMTLLRASVLHTNLFAVWRCFSSHHS